MALWLGLKLGIIVLALQHELKRSGMFAMRLATLPLHIPSPWSLLKSRYAGLSQNYCTVFGLQTTKMCMSSNGVSWLWSIPENVTGHSYVLCRTHWKLHLLRIKQWRGQLLLGYSPPQYSTWVWAVWVMLPLGMLPLAISSLALGSTIPIGLLTLPMLALLSILSVLIRYLLVHSIISHQLWCLYCCSILSQNLEIKLYANYAKPI